MKTFHELTEQQQQAAIGYQFRRFKSLFSEGVIESEKPISDDELLGYAETAAEHSLYQEGSDQVVDGITE